MVRKKTPEKASEPQHIATTETLNLGALMSAKTNYQPFAVWLVGDTPLIVHAWSEKAKREMLQTQVKATKPGKEARDPHGDFINSLYELGKEKGKVTYGFPVTGIKNAILSAAHKDKGLARTTLQSALWLNADMVRVRPALQGAICDMPLVRVHGSEPEMREDMVRIGSGMSKTANLAYRGQFTTWAIKITGEFNATMVSPSALVFLIKEAGRGIGVGEWRNEKKGIFGLFRLADLKEQVLWDKFAAGKGPLPKASKTRDVPSLQDLQAAE